MASQDLPKHRPSLYPQVDHSNPDSASPFIPNPSSKSSSLYPSIHTEDRVENLFPDSPDRMVSDPFPAAASGPAEPVCVEETIIAIPGAIVHLIDNQYSVELACGDFSVVQIRQGDSIVAVLARVADDVQWPLMKDEAAVKVDDSHYFFSLRPPEEAPSGSDSEDEKDAKLKKKKKEEKLKGSQDPNSNILNYGLSFASKGQEKRLKELDRVLEMYTAFSVQKLSVKSTGGALDGMTLSESSPEDLRSVEKREQMEEKCAAYWTTLAPNVEDYSGSAAKLIAAGSGQLIRGILWCGDVTVDGLKWGNVVLKKRLSPAEKREVSRSTLKKIKRAKKMTKMTKKVASGVLSGVVKVSGYVTGSVVNSKVGQKFFSQIPGEIILASFDGFNKICDALEVAGKNVMSTSSTVTTSIVSHRYGDEAGQATQEGLHAAGHAIGTAWAVFKIRQALNPKSAFKATTLAKSAAKAAADDCKTKKESKSKSKSKSK